MRQGRGVARAVPVALALVAASLLVPPAMAATPFASGDAAQGAQLHEKSCRSCHDRMYPDGKGEQLYSKDFRKLRDATSLRQRVESCSSQVGAGWFDEEIDHVSRYLNDRFYGFKGK